MCAMIYSVDSVNCECVPIAWMECHPQYNPSPDCNQRDIDIAMGRDFMQSPYMLEEWYGLFPSEDADEEEINAGDALRDVFIMSGATGVLAIAATIVAASLAILA